MQTDTGCKAKLEQYLRQHRVDYQLEHHPLAYTAREVAATEHVSARRVAKTVMVMADGNLVMVVVRASQDLDLSHFAAAIGATHVRLAEEAEFGPAFPECETGAMPPFGNLYGLRVFVDASLAEDDTIRFEAGTHTDTICMSYADFARLAIPTVVQVGLRHAQVR